MSGTNGPITFGLGLYHLGYEPSLGPVVNILAIFSNANILKNKRIKNIPHQRYRLSVIDFDYIDAWGHPWYFPLIIR